MKKHWTFIKVAILTVCSLSLPAKAAPLTSLNIVRSPSASTFLTGNIQLSGRQLLVDGIPFVMKGVCYSPVKKGMMFPDGLMTLNPSSDDLVTIEKDFQLMQQAGINTIRAYVPITNAAVLALLTKYHLRTIVPICPSWECYQNLDKIAENVELLKNEPSTLMWEIGNEWNINHFYTYDFGSASQDQGSNNLSEQQCLDLIQTVATLIKEHDRTHPIGCDIGCPPLSGKTQNNGDHSEDNANAYQAIPESVDLIGVNVYYGLNFGPGFSTWNQLTDKPFYIGETGAVAWNSNISGEDDAAQALGDRSLAMMIMKNLSAMNPDNILVGGCIFEWCDEWWKQGFPSTHDTTGVIISGGMGPYPARCFNDEWFGILDIDHNPRAAYSAIQSVFNPTFQ